MKILLPAEETAFNKLIAEHADATLDQLVELYCRDYKVIAALTDDQKLIEGAERGSSAGSDISQFVTGLYRLRVVYRPGYYLRDLLLREIVVASQTAAEAGIEGVKLLGVITQKVTYIKHDTHDVILVMGRENPEVDYLFNAQFEYWTIGHPSNNIRGCRLTGDGYQKSPGKPAPKPLPVPPPPPAQRRRTIRHVDE